MRNRIVTITTRLIAIVSLTAALPALADEKPADEKPADEKPADEKPAAAPKPRYGSRRQ